MYRTGCAVQESRSNLTLFILSIFGWCSNSFVCKVRRLKFCTELLWGRINIGSIFCDKKNLGQINNDVTITSLCSNDYRKLLKTSYFKIAATSSSFISSYRHLTEIFSIYIGQKYLAFILLYTQKVRFNIIDISLSL